MLPDIPSLKRDLLDFLQRFIRQRIAFHSYILGEVSRSTIFEGDRGTRIRRADGTTDEGPLQAAESSVEFSRQEIPNLGLDALLQRADAVARDFARQQSQHLFRSLEEVTDRTGNVINVNGPPTPDALLAMIETVEMDFDAAGRHNFSFVVPPNLHEAALAVWELIMNDPVYRERYDALMARKMEEHRAREASRKLVG